MNLVRRWNKAVRAIALALAAALLLAGCGTDAPHGSTVPASAGNSTAETQQTMREQETGAVTLPETAPGTEPGSGTAAETTPGTAVGSETEAAPETETGTEAETEAETETEEHEMTLQMTIGGTAVNVKWEENESAEALKTLCKDNPLTIQMSMYGGFEQVGRIGRSLPRADVQTTTQAGDVVLYSGNQLVIFYGSNSWAYTRLGHVTDKTAREMAELLGNGDITVTIELK